MPTRACGPCNHFPSEKVGQAYGFTPDQAWLDHVQLSSARWGQGCSASFVSPEGLVMTNHHCARSCVQNLSTPQNNYIANGFYAKAPDQEAALSRTRRPAVDPYQRRDRTGQQGHCRKDG